RNGRPLPDLMVALRGQVDFDLAGKITIPRSRFLRTDFDAVPDVPISEFTLKLFAGRNGSVGNAANLCTSRSRRARVTIGFTAQSGKLVERSQRLGIRGCRARARSGRGRRAGRGRGAR
ncbi:MAG TPA: hypothetical protein VK506_16640, partial [Conexibacter sp.]|nr:hypothetical protein [Conexibacter sp.]